MRTVENAGHKIRMLCNATIQFKELNALLASTRITASVSCALNISLMEWMAASAPPFKPAADCNGPAASCMSSLSTHPITFPTIRRSTFPIPMGRTPGFLFNGMRRHERNASMDLGSTIVPAKFLASLAISSRRSFPSFLYLELSNTLRNCSASSYDGPPAPFVKRAALCIILSSMASK